MNLEVRVAMSATPSFVNRTRLLAASVREFYPDALVRAFVGARAERPAEKLMLELDGDDIQVEWVGGQRFDAWRGTRNEYVGTMAARYEPMFEADYVLMLDADVICLKPFDELLNAKALSGVQAHIPPFSNDVWKRLLVESGLPPRWNQHPFTGWQAMFTDPAMRFGPPYANTGVLFGPATLFERLWPAYDAALTRLRSQMDTYFFEQIALTLAAAEAGVPLNIVPLRYNFPNQAEFDRLHPEELADCRFLHYLRTDTVDREWDFESRAAMARLVARPGLTGSNLLLQRRVGELLGRVWPADGYTAEDAPYA
jgi:hypothetical protein